MLLINLRRIPNRSRPTTRITEHLRSVDWGGGALGRWRGGAAPKRAAGRGGQWQSSQQHHVRNDSRGDLGAHPCWKATHNHTHRYEPTPAECWASCCWRCLLFLLRLPKLSAFCLFGCFRLLDGTPAAAAAQFLPSCFWRSPQLQLQLLLFGLRFRTSRAQ